MSSSRELFSPEAAAVDRAIMRGHWVAPHSVDDFPAADRAYWKSMGLPYPPPLDVGGRRRTTDTPMIDAVLDMSKRGLMPGLIADTLNVADRRVRSIIRQHADKAK